MSLKIRVGLKGSSPGPVPHLTIISSNLVSIQYLAIIDTCHVLDPTSRWVHEVRLKWPHDIYTLFPSSKPTIKPEAGNSGEILVNRNFAGGVADVIIGSGFNVLNAPPFASLAQLASTPTPGLCRTRNSSSSNLF
ncbi:hypothetical protein F4604DRAFT_1086496 [Suillus subluteus]|nr:hypothetical protein F4604DRAFT_1086496 [Suillus subluteus]